MKSKLQEILKTVQNQGVEDCQQAVSEELRIEVLEYFGLYDFVSIDEDYNGEVYEYNNEGVYGPWAKAYSVVSEEEFQRLLSLYNLQVYNMKVQIQKEEAKPLAESNPYGHSAEHKLNSIALWFVVIGVICSIGLVVACASFADSFNDSKMMAIVIFFAIVISGILIAMFYMWYLTIKVFTNISSRTTEIHKLLKDKK